MIESRRVIPIKQGDGSTLYRVIIKSVDCAQSGQDAMFVKRELLKQIVQNFDLLNTAGIEFTNFTFGYKDGKWVIETRIIEENKNNL